MSEMPLLRPARASRVRACSFVLGALAAVVVAGPVSAHGPVPPVPPDAGNLVFGWSIEPAVILPLVAAVFAWIRIVRSIDRAHPANPVPRRRSVAFLGGLAVIAVALLSGIDTYDTTLFSVHMVQHVLLTLVAAPLIALGAPITTLLRASSPDVRRRVILPILHSRVMRIASFPVVAWLLFAVTMWGTHFSPLFDASLENPGIHDLEHALYLGAGLLFWWPAIGLDPSPWRMPHPVRAMYVFLQMPQNTFLAVTILNSSVVLYHHYATLGRSWGPPPLEDQQIAGGLMWICGDILFLTAMGAILAGWMRHEQRREVDVDRRLDAERAAIRVREAQLAERLGAEHEGR
ncbi:MAG TPA: cytochrome c oxidase assembly protein [Candidatus Limnocylindrales bacterium]|nr:cytochrome c oxidase assembly protein [Candidatus Limnocylindrales bacterium]